VGFRSSAPEDPLDLFISFGNNASVCGIKNTRVFKKPFALD
jgi:hypothetical protein